MTQKESFHRNVRCTVNDNRTKKCLLEDTFIFAYPFLADVSIYTPLKTLKTEGFHNLSFT